MHFFGMASLLIILIVASCVSNSIATGKNCSSNNDCNTEELCVCDGAGNCSCQEKIAAKIVYHQCKKDHDCAKMCAPSCKPSCLNGLCRCECTINARKTMIAVYPQCKKDDDCYVMVEPSCKPGCKPACIDGLCICKC
ncbi:hypothetical protein V6N12_041994 [Hibiscus sabdariffa]|uniref:Uncharacterized protein n=1 Tax=Hibiscus sabdariffa TaxID=183260 RepID=A0ABR2EDG8_9ROSI